jgi:hypothetical protein
MSRRRKFLKDTFERVSVLEFYTIEGRRKNSVFFVAGGKIYQKEKELLTFVQLRCKYHKVCKGRARIKEGVFYQTHPHVCELPQEDVDSIYLK